MSKGKGFINRDQAKRDEAKQAKEAQVGKGKSSEHVYRKAGSGGVREARDEKRQ